MTGIKSRKRDLHDMYPSQTRGSGRRNACERWISRLTDDVSCDLGFRIVGLHDLRHMLCNWWSMERGRSKYFMMLVAAHCQQVFPLRRGRNWMASIVRVQTLGSHISAIWCPSSSSRVSCTSRTLLNGRNLKEGKMYRAMSRWIFCDDIFAWTDGKYVPPPPAMSDLCFRCVLRVCLCLSGFSVV